LVELVGALIIGTAWLTYHSVRFFVSGIQRAWRFIRRQSVSVDDDSEVTLGTSVAERRWLGGTVVQTPPRSQFYRKNSLLTAAESNFFTVLRGIADQNNYVIQTKVRLEALIGVRFYQENWWGLRNRIKSREMDFVLCDNSMQPLLIIELDDSSHFRQDRQQRDRDLNRILNNAGFPILHIPAAYSYNAGEIKEQIIKSIHQQP
jgi:very-short-patch-repair endonuclease